MLIRSLSCSVARRLVWPPGLRRGVRLIDDFDRHRAQSIEDRASARIGHQSYRKISSGRHIAICAILRDSTHELNFAKALVSLKPTVNLRCYAAPDLLHCTWIRG